MKNTTSKNKRWTIEELEILNKDYTIKTTKELLNLLPYRTRRAIEYQARIRNLRKTKETLKRIRKENNNLRKLKKENPSEFIKHQRKAGKKAGIKLKEWLKNNPSIHSIAGKKAHINHPNLACRMGKRCHELHPDQGRKNFLITYKKYPEMFSQNGKKVGLWLKQNRPEHFKKMAIKAQRVKRISKPHYWQGVAFDSKAEKEIAEQLLNIPIEGINCHINVGSHIIDFFPQRNDKIYQNHFVEYHPYDWDGLSTQEYYDKRLNIIKKSKFKNIPLIVLFSKKTKEIDEKYGGKK